MATRKCWSYSTGERGRNRVRAFEVEPGGILFLEWYEPVLDDAGAPVLVMHRQTRQMIPRQRRKRISLGTRDRAVAVAKAEALKESHAELADATVTADAGPLTLAHLFTLYEQEVTPEKKPTSQAHDRQAMRMFLAFFGADAIVERLQDGKAVTELGRARYNAFIRARREGRIPGFPRKVGDRAVEADVRFMIAVFNWAMVERADGTVLLQRNPWQGFPVPRERNPKRPSLTPEIEAKLLEHCTLWRVRLALVLCRETGRRVGAVRHLRWSDIEVWQEAGRWKGRIRWAPDHDKTRRGRVTPISERAVQALREAPRGIGQAWVFPAPKNPELPASKDYFKRAMLRLKKRAGVDIPHLGYHSGKRAKVRDPEFRQLDPKIREALLDTNYETLRRIYDDITLEDLEKAVG